MSVLKFVEPLGINRSEKTVTFSDTGGGSIILFNVTGDVIVRIIPVCVEDIVADSTAPNIKLETENNDVMIADTVAEDLVARKLWLNTSPDNEIEPVSNIQSYIITDGNDIVLTLDVQIDSGGIVFYCFWSPLSTNGHVESA